MVRRLLQGLDQVVSVLRVYGPEGTFADALKERKKERRRRETLLEMLPGSLKKKAAEAPQHVAQSVEPDLYTQARVPPGEEAWRNDSYYISLNISLPFCSKKNPQKKNQEGFFLIRTQADSLTSSTPEAMTVCIFRSKRRLMKLSAPNPSRNQSIDYGEGRNLVRGSLKTRSLSPSSTSQDFHLDIAAWRTPCLRTPAAEESGRGREWESEI